jgi:hypothetical protein
MPLDPNPKSQPVHLPDWSAFQLAMMTNQAYTRISRMADQRVVSRIELYFSTKAENWPLAAQMWAGMLASCPEAQRPTKEESIAWAEIALRTAMPISFANTGHLLPTNA